MCVCVSLRVCFCSCSCVLCAAVCVFVFVYVCVWCECIYTVYVRSRKHLCVCVCSVDPIKADQRRCWWVFESNTGNWRTDTTRHSGWGCRGSRHPCDVLSDVEHQPSSVAMNQRRVEADARAAVRRKRLTFLASWEMKRSSSAQAQVCLRGEDALVLSRRNTVFEASDISRAFHLNTKHFDV